jgi:hypothetical protein
MGIGALNWYEAWQVGHSPCRLVDTYNFTLKLVLLLSPPSLSFDKNSYFKKMKLIPLVTYLYLFHCVIIICSNFNFFLLCTINGFRVKGTKTEM